MIASALRKLTASDARAAHNALLAIGWTRQQIERLTGRRCAMCFGARGNHNQSGVCYRCAGTQTRQREVDVKCPCCLSVRRRVGAKLKISPCSRDCRTYVRKCRESGVTP